MYYECTDSTEWPLSSSWTAGNNPFEKVKCTVLNQGCVIVGSMVGTGFAGFPDSFLNCRGTQREIS